ncbi:methyltransferase domain-containing protein [Mesorhizobium sp. LHD-90]|uniref:class I SAM-dependent methyltransferase n=1 Tax=Mesorhizobium sp. LHD-90 TaxID=3071414 RepID=UPI0027E0E0E8|nr:methyltransferase domain-containing protein [Mesorhizobium sp. LHD-90]MDQ6436430.1 methyltransferase domain-containing protein [Mesorhizobium sp. LHD-90]
MTGNCVQSDFVRFFRSWVSAPMRVAAVAPSGPVLARLITQEISPRDGPVLELGPGTGVFTRALLARGVPESDLTLIEFGSEFAKLLALRFPQARVISLDAARLAQAGLFEPGSVGVAVSGLPLLSMPLDKVEAILAGVFAVLKPGGALYQFTYGPRCPVPPAILGRNGLQATRTGWALRNIPPATVYRISRMDDAAAAIFERQAA